MGAASATFGDVKINMKKKQKRLTKNVRCSPNKNNAITTTTKILQYVISWVYWCNNSNNDFCNRLHIVYSIAVSYIWLSSL